MDQPDTRNENETPVVPQDDVVQQSTPSDDAVPITVTVPTDDTALEQPVDSVMDGVPSSGVTEPVGSNESDSINTAEEAVEEALPQSTDEELAAVASELENMAASNTPMDEPVTDKQPEVREDNDNDPMKQIMRDAEAGSMYPPSADSSPLPLIQPDSMDNQSIDEPLAQDQATPDGNNEQVGTMGADNGYGAEPVFEDNPLQQDSPAEESVEEPNFEQPVASEMMPEGNTDMVEQPAASENLEPERAEDIPVVDAPSYSAPLSDEPSQLTHEESPAGHSETNDVVTPSIVAAAVAAGTSGDNAITGTPESSTTAVAQETQVQGGSTQRKSKKGTIIAVVVMVTLLFGGGAVAAYMMRPGETDNVVASELTEEESNENALDALDSTAVPGEKVVADVLDDYKAACSSGGMVTNADSYNGSGPHPLVVFEKGSDDKFAQSLVNFKDTAWGANAAEVTSGQLVACITRKAESEVKLKDCPITDSVTKVTADVPFYSATYTVDLYEAQTGEKVSSFDNSSISTTCPTNVAYDKNDPKIYAGFDQIELEKTLTVPVTADL